jgi:hypothetical protein
MSLEPLTVISSIITAIATGVMIWAVFKAPQKAFEAQWRLQQRQEARNRRVLIFSTLMATRGNILHYRHVEALNMIDVEFSEPSEQDIRDAWKTYLDHLNTLSQATQEPSEEATRAAQDRREDRRKDLLAELLQKMGSHLSYDFPFTYLKDRAYYPRGHGRIVEEEGELRRGLIEMLWKGRPLIVRAVNPPIDAPPAKPSDLKH